MRAADSFTQGPAGRARDRTTQDNSPWRWGNQGWVCLGPGRVLISSHLQVYLKQSLHLSTPWALKYSVQMRAAAQ